ncbi:hypothetical protein B0A49_01426 [Cryomyces minteri]|uniref:GH16 domain-containing protein n=1 Tax=Cryomyces minteri TaxID=331657 RepID=A0A4U0XUC9_9PEZI|nr:hypothetical protein B0A49_01426 [Cryomyces minteri]
MAVYVTVLIALLTSVIQPASSQLSTSCNPIINSTCPPDPALSATFAYDFGALDESVDFSTASWWHPWINYSESGVMLSFNRSGVAPTLTTNFYIMFGRVEVVIKTAAGQGIISDVILQSDDLDEIDLEWVGGSPTQVQTNYYSPKGKAVSYSQAYAAEIGSNLQTAYHSYVVDWNADRIIWHVDGKVIHQVNSANNDQYPQTPMRLTLGIWAGGDPGNYPGTINWAGGVTDYTQGPFNLSVKSVNIADYSSGVNYTYKDHTGSWSSIGSVNGTVHPNATAAANNHTISVFASASPAFSTPIALTFYIKAKFNKYYQYCLFRRHREYKSCIFVSPGRFYIEFE